MMLTLILALAAFLPLDSIASGNEGKDWMAKIDDGTEISRLSIPGSHDSGALHSIADVSGKCQTLTVSPMDIVFAGTALVYYLSFAMTAASQSDAPKNKKV